MIKFKRFDHVQICIPKDAEDEARKFYTDIIGLKEKPKPQSLIANGGLWYQVADVELHLSVEMPMVKTRRHPAFEIEDVAAARKLLENVVEIMEEPVIPGRVRFSFIDPFGNKLELLQITDPTIDNSI
jgi:catechol 2,3-dioxygenase-like lactoylglutathione lyase family enzyme